MAQQSESGLDVIGQAIVRMEGSLLPNSVNMTMVQKYGLWNVGHLVWAGQYGAQKVYLGRDWAGWPSQEEAYAGLLRDIAAKARVGHTIRTGIEKYAPPNENNTEAYIAYIVNATGYPDYTPLSSVIAGSRTPGLPGNTPTPDSLPTYSDPAPVSDFNVYTEDPPEPPESESPAASVAVSTLWMAALGLGGGLVLLALLSRH